MAYQSFQKKKLPKSKSSAQRDAERNGTSWKKKTQMAVDAALEVAENHTELFWLMNKQGYQVRWKNEYKYILFTNPDGKKMRNRIFESRKLYKGGQCVKDFRENYKRHKNKEPDEKSESLNYRTETFFIVRDVANTATSKEEFIQLMEQE